jgi:serine/threonine protein kinase/WD40 repeat protein
MDLPEEAQWNRVEQLADEISALPPNQISGRLAELAAAGESPAVLTLLRAWISLPPVVQPFVAGSELSGRFTLVEKLGDGGMGSVWRARQELIGRDVALKIIHPSLVSPGLKARFVAEMEILGKLNHPGIIRIFDADIHQQPGGMAIPFFAMELVEGQTLDTWAAAHRKSRVALLRVAAEVSNALGHAHERQIVHRDLKPSNILVRKDGRPVLVDFGIARLRGLVLGEREGDFSGTPEYAAPEQHLCRDHDFRSGESVDIYAVGVILFEMLTGRRLFEFEHGASMDQMRQAVLEGSALRLSQVLPDCPPALEEIVSRAVRRDPADRFYSIASLGRAIDRVGREISSPRSVSTPWTPTAGSCVPGTSWILLEKIGRGGAGEVWVGVHKQLDERRVFKFCETEENARTLKREVTLFRLLKERIGRNPHFIPLDEVSLDEPPWYLMMDYVDARDLEAWSAAQPGGLALVSESRRLEIVIQAAEALQAAHEAGILHRDIKPANLLVRDGPEARLHIFLADFGIGQIVTDQLWRDQPRLGFTRTVSGLRRETLSGTLLYLAPEILEGSPATVRSDIYSLGVVLWQLLIGHLNVALDASEWSSRISDSVLRDIVRRCLAGSADHRWASAGELAATLRGLPDLRAEEERRQVEIRECEAAAYRQGMVRTALFGGLIISVFIGLAALAWRQSRAARRAQGDIALEQAQTLFRSDLTMGRRNKGMQLLSTAAMNTDNRAALRSAAASVFGLTDLVRAGFSGNPKSKPGMDLSLVSRQGGEVARAASDDGSVLAIARDLDGLNGAVDLIDMASNRLRLTITRKEFPWVPIAESGLLCFSPDHQLLAVGGARTSRHVLLFETATGALRTYLFHGADPLSCAWHPVGRLFATGSSDGKVRIWDVDATVRTKHNAEPANQFDLPPRLDVPALDNALFPLEGQRDRVEHLAFGPEGHWLAVLDRAGYLRIFSGFTHASTSRGPLVEGRQYATGEVSAPLLSVEARIDKPEQVTTLVARPKSVLIVRDGARSEWFKLTWGELPNEAPLGPDPIHICWNDQASTFCVLSRTDAYWLKPSPFEVFYHSPGINPDAVVWDAGTSAWLLPTGNKLGIFRLGGNPAELSLITNCTLVGALKDQAAVTALAGARDGRIAIYHGRRIQFFKAGIAASLASSMIVEGTPGRFQDLLWDEQGRLLAAVFAQPNGALHFQAWRTSSDFPPKCIDLTSAILESERVIEANDGANFITRGTQRGLELVQASTGTRRIIDDSITARQNAALACSPDGAFLALVVDRNVVRIMQMPEGALFAELHSPRPVLITALFWDHTASHLITLTDDGYVQLWKLKPWQQWMADNHLEK